MVMLAASGSVRSTAGRLAVGSTNDEYAEHASDAYASSIDSGGLHTEFVGRSWGVRKSRDHAESCENPAP
eukprot:2732689-Prorocentrum_lima.AAC.1